MGLRALTGDVLTLGIRVIRRGDLAGGVGGGGVTGIDGDVRRGMGACIAGRSTCGLDGRRLDLETRLRGRALLRSKASGR